MGQQKFAAAPVGESGDEISDIDARLNALQSFLQVAALLSRSLAHARACFLLSGQTACSQALCTDTPTRPSREADWCLVELEQDSLFSL